MLNGRMARWIDELILGTDLEAVGNNFIISYKHNHIHFIVQFHCNQRLGKI